VNNEAYLESSDEIDWTSAAVAALAQQLVSPYTGPVRLARTCFEWVRDEISHSGDIKANVTTCSASEVLRERTGWCFAKSHLLAALLRANGLPAGLCYQRLQRDDGDGFTLHGLNAVLLPDIGWYRVDARGNKAGVNAQFAPPLEHLAWPAVLEGECDLPGIHPHPLPTVVACLRRSTEWTAVAANLPDVE
jgi:transglutaminase-like putative cysteine protease